MVAKISASGGKREFGLLIKGTRLDDDGLWYEFGFKEGAALYLMPESEWIQLGRPDEIIVTVKLEAVSD